MTRAVKNRTGIMTIKSLTTLFRRLPDIISNKDVILQALFHNSAIITLATIEKSIFAGFDVSLSIRQWDWFSTVKLLKI